MKNRNLLMTGKRRGWGVGGEKASKNKTKQKNPVSLYHNQKSLGRDNFTPRNKLKEVIFCSPRLWRAGKSHNQGKRL